MYYVQLYNSLQYSRSSSGLAEAAAAHGALGPGRDVEGGEGGAGAGGHGHAAQPHQLRPRLLTYIHIVHPYYQHLERAPTRRFILVKKIERNSEKKRYKYKLSTKEEAQVRRLSEYGHTSICKSCCPLPPAGAAPTRRPWWHQWCGQLQCPCRAQPRAWLPCWCQHTSDCLHCPRPSLLQLVTNLRQSFTITE